MHGTGGWKDCGSVLPEVESILPLAQLLTLSELQSPSLKVGEY